MYTPEVGEILTVVLPYETTRAEVKHVESPIEVIAHLNQARPFSKNHHYSFDDWIRVVKHDGAVPGTNVWKAEGIVPRPVQVPEEEQKPMGKRRERKAK